MLKMVGTTPDGQVVVFLGLSRENLRRLQADRPIKVRLEEVGLGVGELVIFFGETEESMLADLQRAGVRFPVGDP